MNESEDKQQIEIGASNAEYVFQRLGALAAASIRSGMTGALIATVGFDAASYGKVTVRVACMDEKIEIVDHVCKDNHIILDMGIEDAQRLIQKRHAEDLAYDESDPPEVVDRKEKKMNDLNSILIEGEVEGDPLDRTTSNGTPVCVFTVVSRRCYKQTGNYKKEQSLFEIEAWSLLGKKCLTELKPGRGVRVVGRLKQDRWTDPEGKTRSRVKIVAEHVEFQPQKIKEQGKETP